MRRRSFIGVLVTLLLCVALAGGAFAQGGGRGGFGGQRGGFGQGGLQMLRIPEVQKELKMTPEQVSKLESKQGEVREATMALFQSGGNPQDMTPEERQAMMAKMQEIQTKAVNDILDATQQKRFKELELQQMGPSAVSRKDVAEALKLTDEQKKGVADIQRKLNEDRRAAMEGIDFRSMSPEERQAMMTKNQAMQKAADEKIVALLTADQKAKWTEMTGAAFTFPPQRGPGGGGRRRDP